MVEETASAKVLRQECARCVEEQQEASVAEMKQAKERGPIGKSLQGKWWLRSGGCGRRKGPDLRQDLLMDGMCLGLKGGERSKDNPLDSAMS